MSCKYNVQFFYTRNTTEEARELVSDKLGGMKRLERRPEWVRESMQETRQSVGHGIFYAGPDGFSAAKICPTRNGRIGVFIWKLHDFLREPARPFFGCVNPGNCNPAAHGNVVYRERCTSCGLYRDVAVNQGHVETGTWCNDVQDGPRANIA